MKLFRTMPGEFTNEQLFEALRYGEAKVTHGGKYRKTWEFRAGEVKNVIVTKNEGLVWTVVFKYPSFMQDRLYDECMGAVARCIRCFDLARGFKFTTYVMNSMYRACARLFRERKCLTIEDVDASYVSSPDDTGRRDIQESIREILDRNLACLTPQEEEVLRQRFYNDKRLHQIQTSEKHVSKERIRQIQEKALKKIREYLEEEEAEIEGVPDDELTVELDEVAA